MQLKVPWSVLLVLMQRRFKCSVMQLEEVNDENRVQIANYLCTVSGTNFLVANMSYWRANIQCSEQGTIQSCLANTLVNPESE
jgi:hypothetical protein